jgi:hypothetical protein
LVHPGCIILHQYSSPVYTIAATGSRIIRLKTVSQRSHGMSAESYLFHSTMKVNFDLDLSDYGYKRKNQITYQYFCINNQGLNVLYFENWFSCNTQF